VNGCVQGGTEIFKESSMKTAVFTIGQIADELGQSPSRVNYLLSKYRIKPVARVANIRLFDRTTVEKIRWALRGQR
jgi:DNA-binding transcriptional MerR regulator